jgi:hypothetical protein
MNGRPRNKWYYWIFAESSSWRGKIAFTLVATFLVATVANSCFGTECPVDILEFAPAQLTLVHV